MVILEDVAVGIVAVLHVYFLILEMFLWQTPRGLRVFGMTPAVAAQSATLAKNQGLYNGFLAAGLVWSFFLGDSGCQESIRLFFLACVAVAGIFGALTAKPIIFWVQALPALIAGAIVLIH